MTNEEIILKSVQAHLTPAQRHEIAAAAYTPEQIAHAVEHIPDGLDELAASQVHTFAWWKDNGKSVKRGEKALFTCPLWKYTDKPSNAQIKAAEAAGKEVQPAVHYYPTTSYMFSCLQVESSKPAPAGRFKSIHPKPKGAHYMTTTASREDWILNQQERESDDCAGCPFAGVDTCRNQCHEVTAIYNPNLTH